MTIIAEAFVRIRPDDKDFPKQVETSAQKAAQKGSAAASKELSSGFKKAGRESHTAFLSAFTHFGDEIKHRFFAGLQFGVGAFTGIQAFSALAKVFGEGFQSEKLFQSSTAQLNQVLRTTHAVSGETATGVDKLAERIANYSGETDNALRNSDVMLLGFTNIRNVLGKNNDIFDRASVAAEDLSKRYGIDVSQAARTLGRALNDPARGLLLLRRAGIQLTAQQATQAEKLAKSGRILEAQKVILAAVEQRVGGAARAYGRTLPGAVDIAREKFNKFSRQLTEALLPALTRAGIRLLDFGQRIAPDVSKAFRFLGIVLGATITVLGRLAAAVRSTVGWAERNKAVLLPLAAAFGAVAAAIVVYTAVTKAAAAAQLASLVVTTNFRVAFSLLNTTIRENPFVAVAVVVLALAAAFVTAWKTSETFRDTVKAVFADIEHAVGVAISVIVNAFRLWADAQLKVFSVIAHGAAAALGWVPGLGAKLKDAVHQFDNFRVGVDGQLRAIANQAYSLGLSGGSNFANGFGAGISGAQAFKDPAFKKLFGPAVKQLFSGDLGGLAQYVPGPTPATDVGPAGAATSPDFTSPAVPSRHRHQDRHRSHAPVHAIAKAVVARAVPISLTSAEVIKAIADAVQKGGPGVLAELTKLASKIRVTLNDPAAHAARDRVIEFLNRRRESLARLADQYASISQRIDDTTQKLTDAQQAQADFFSNLRDTFTSAGDLANVLQGLSDQVQPGGEAVGGFLQHQVNQLNGFLANLDALKAEGLAPELIKQLASQGPDTGGRIAAGLVGASKEQIDRINALEAQLQSRAAAGAQQLTNDFYQSGIDQLTSQLADLKQQQASTTAAVKHLESVIGDEVGTGVADGLNAVAKAANAKAKAKTRQASAGAKAR